MIVQLQCMLHYNSLHLFLPPRKESVLSNTIQLQHFVLLGIIRFSH